MRIGIYGGSFNPVHFGHVGLADWVSKHTDVDEVWMLVSPNNPIKAASELADEHVRLQGLQEAIERNGNKRLKASDFEFTLPRPSYTANTLRELKKTYPEHEFVLIIGEDNWVIFDRWREWEYILKNYPILVYPRHGSGANVAWGGDVEFLKDAPYYDISSTEIRNKEKK